MGLALKLGGNPECPNQANLLKSGLNPNRRVPSPLMG